MRICKYILSEKIPGNKEVSEKDKVNELEEPARDRLWYSWICEGRKGGSKEGREEGEVKVVFASSSLD